MYINYIHIYLFVFTSNKFAMFFFFNLTSFPSFTVHNFPVQTGLFIEMLLIRTKEIHSIRITILKFTILFIHFLCIFDIFEREDCLLCAILQERSCLILWSCSNLFNQTLCSRLKSIVF